MNTPQIILGTFQNNNYHDLFNVVDSAFSEGCYAFDTAPSYGTEQMLGKALFECSQKYGIKRENIYVSDKVDAWQMIEGQGNVECYVTSALSKMGLDYFDIVWIHWPIDELLPASWTSLTKLQADGIVKSIGICNVRERHLIKMISKGIIPESIQIERHPMRICKDEMTYCKEHGIKVFDYSPICRMHSNLRNSQILKSIADKYHKNIGQVILRWHIDTGAVPIFMSKRSDRVKSNLDLFDFKLNNHEITQIDDLDENYKIFLESWGCPGF